jgi:hypothetical protein
MYYVVCGLITGLEVKLQEKAMLDTVIAGRMQNSDIEFYDILIVIFTQ